MRRARIPVDVGDDGRFRKHRLAERHAGESGRVEARERVERVALDFGARHRGVQESEVERRIVADEHRAPTIGGAHRGAHFPENPLQRIALRNRRAQRVMRIDPVDRQRGRLDVRARKRLHVKRVALAAAKVAVRVKIDHHGRDLEQRIGRGIESARLDVHDDRQEAAKPAGHGDPAHDATLASSCHDRASPARQGTSVSLPNA